MTGGEWPSYHTHGDPGVECEIWGCEYPSASFLCENEGPSPGCAVCVLPLRHREPFHESVTGARWKVQRCSNGCPEWRLGRHKFSCGQAGPVGGGARLEPYPLLGGPLELSDAELRRGRLTLRPDRATAMLRFLLLAASARDAPALTWKELVGNALLYETNVNRDATGAAFEDLRYLTVEEVFFKYEPDEEDEVEAE
jgi:hypothetical protein